MIFIFNTNGLLGFLNMSITGIRDTFRLKNVVPNWTFCLGGKGGKPQSKWFGTLFNMMSLNGPNVTKCP